MPLSAIDLCSRALLGIGANQIQSFDEGTAEAEIASALYDLVREGVLSIHPWNFCRGQAKLARLSAAPVTDYEYAYQLPSDMLTIRSIGQEESTTGLIYRRAELRIHTDADEVWLDYTFKPDESLHPPYFNIALVSSLSARFAIPLTESTSRWEGLAKMAEHDLRRARLADAQEDTPSRIDDFTLVNVRG